MIKYRANIQKQNSFNNTPLWVANIFQFYYLKQGIESDESMARVKTEQPLLVGLRRFCRKVESTASRGIARSYSKVGIGRGRNVGG